MTKTKMLVKKHKVQNKSYI